MTSSCRLTLLSFSRLKFDQPYADTAVRMEAETTAEGGGEEPKLAERKDLREAEEMRDEERLERERQPELKPGTPTGGETRA